MADVFVSYAKTDRSLASKLVAMLEAEGWSVWWDKSLGAADLYRDEIMKQLVSARAVIAIWTPNSIRSDWVRAEAGTAKNEGKLIPVKTSDVAYADIPLPFGEMHTENVEASQLIRAAVVAQLAKPAVEPSALTLLTKGFRYEVLTWIGIVGGALTLFTNLSAVLKLADWARLLVQSWKEWTHAFWLWAFGWLGIHLAPELTPILSFLLFGSFLLKSTIKNQANVDTHQGKSFQLISWRTLLCVVCACLPLIIYLSLSHLLTASTPVEVAIFLVFLVLVAPPVVIVLFARHKKYAALSAFLTTTFFIIISLIQTTRIMVDVAVLSGHYQPPFDPDLLAVSLFVPNVALMILLLSVAPAKAISGRLIFLAIGLLLLIALNELSKLGLDVTAPKHQG
jgi:hypothetical protein